MATWDQLTKQFLHGLYLIMKYLERKHENCKLKQQDGENLYDAWERLKLLLKRRPRHNFH